MKTKNNKTNEKKKIYYLIPLLIIALLLLIGTTLAYFSDMFSQTEEGSTSTLNISGKYMFYLNGTETNVNSMKSLNPGDVIVIKADVSNIGNQSAWIREKFILDTEDESILNYFEIYDGNFTQADFLSENDYSDYLIPFTNGEAKLPNKVVNGFGVNGEVENGTEFNYLDSSSYLSYITVYFLPSASNEAQGKSFGLTVATQALQFRNNNSYEPNELAWSTVSTITTFKK